MIAKIKCLKDWTNRRKNFTYEVDEIIHNNYECRMIWLAIFEVIESRHWRDGNLTKKQLKKINHLIDDLNHQIVYAILRLSGENNA